MLARLEELNLLGSIHPALSFDKSMLERLEKLPTYRGLQHLSPWNITKGEQMNDSDLGWLLWLMSLSQEQVAALNERLHFTADLLASLFAVSMMYADQSSFVGLKPSKCVERLEFLPRQRRRSGGIRGKRPACERNFR